MKRLTALLLALVLCAGLLPLPARGTEGGSDVPAETQPPQTQPEVTDIVREGTCGDNLTWTLDDAGTLTISGQGRMSFGDPTRHLDAPWARQKDRVFALVVQEGVTSIWENAFRDFSNLTAVTLPRSLETIYSNAFDGCTQLRILTLPEGLKTINAWAFLGCTALESITLPATLTHLGQQVFDRCSGLQTVTFLGENPGGYQCFKGVTATVYYPEGESWTEEAMTQAGEDLTWQVLPEHSCGDGLTWSLSEEGTLTISGQGRMQDYPDAAPWALMERPVRRLVLEEGVTGISSRAFSGCDQLTDLVLPQSLLSIGESAFRDCTGLSRVRIPGQVMLVGENAFAGCENLAELVLEGNQAIFLPGSFAGCTALGRLEVRSGIRKLGRELFPDCPSLEDIRFTAEPPAFVHPQAFSGIQARASYPEDNALWENVSFENWGGNLTWERTPYLTGSCGDSLHWGLSADGILTLWGAGAMTLESGIPWEQSRDQIRRLVVEAGVGSIAGQAFAGCSSLRTLVFYGSAPQIAPDAFTDVTATAKYPQDSPTWTGDLRSDYGGTLTWEGQ